MRHVSVQQLSAFLDSALVGVSRELVMRHLAACANCRDRHVSWKDGDDVLRRVLSWVPDERTLEEWSSRVELTLTAERKGLPAPEFSELQHPVLAPAPKPGPDRLNDVVRSVRRTRRSDAVVPPASSVRSSPPAEATPVPVEPAAAGHEPATVAPVESLEPAAVEPTPVLAAEAPEVEPEAIEPTAIEPAPVAPAPVEATPVASAWVAPTPAWPAPVRLESARVPASRPEPTPAPPATRVQWPTPAVAATPAPAHATPRRPASHDATTRARPWILAAVALVVALVSSPFLPEVIRIPIPERWRWHLPRVEFVRRDKGIEPPVPAPSTDTRLATRLALEPERVPPAAIPVPAEVESSAVAEPVRVASSAALAQGTDSVATAGTSEAPAEREPEAVKPAVPAPARATPARATPTRAVASRPSPSRAAPARSTPPPAQEPAIAAGGEGPGTVVPTRVSTTVALSPRRDAAPAPAPAPPPLAAASPPPESEEEWPLLCGEVLGPNGAPVAGARVVLLSNSLSMRTDRRGRFCVACPPGRQSLRVEAEGLAPQTRVVELMTGMVETRFSLTAVR